MMLWAYLALGFLLLLFAYLVFRVIVRRNYREYGRLNWLASVVQLLVFLAYFCFPYLFNSPDWPWFWVEAGSTSPVLHWVGLALICAGLLLAFGTMLWFGLGKAFGAHAEGLTRRGPYKISRNPQIIGGYFMVIGAFLQWSSLYGLGWVGMYVIIAHWMIITEEEHLGRVFGNNYAAYCVDVPRYILLRRA